MKKDPRVYLAQIVECIERILKDAAGGREVFFIDQFHRYGGVDLLEGWRVREDELPPLKAAITTILPPPDQREMDDGEKEETRIRR